MVGRDVIVAGGNAADAAAAMGMALAVTLPSRAGLGAGGTCTVFDTKSGKSGVLTFAADGAAPVAARGLAALQIRFGKRPWSNAVAPAETFARFGFPVSKMLSADLAADGNALMSDQAALSAFMDRRRQFAAVGAEVRLPAMADALANLRAQGALSAGAAPEWSAAETVKIKSVSVLGPARADASAPDTPATASTAFVVGDKDGLAVACILSMGKRFGTGRLNADGYLAAAPGAVRMLPGVMLDVQAQHVVAIAAAHGPKDVELVTAVTNAWLLDGSYERGAEQVRTFAGTGTAIAAAVCPAGLAIIGSECRTMIDANGHGLGQTFGPEIRR